MLHFAACSDSGPGTPLGPEDPPDGETPEKLRIFPSSISLPLGDRYVFDVLFAEVPEQAVNWSATGGTLAADGGMATYTAPMQPGTYTIRVTGATDATVRGSATVVVEAPSTGPSAGPSGPDLIDQALAAGQLDVSTATRYKAYWAFRDPRLPTQFSGAPGAGPSAHPPPEILNPPAGVSAEVRAELERYSLPPTHPDSWFQIRWREENSPTAGIGAPANRQDLARGEAIRTDLIESAFQLLGYDSELAASGRVKVWWERRRPGDRAVAQTLAADLDAVWSFLAANLDHEPRGAYGREVLDVFLFGLGVDGFVAVTSAEAASPGGTCPDRGSYIQINRDIVGRFPGVLAHEMLHAFIHAIPKPGPCSEYEWFHEALATWVETLHNPSGRVEPADERVRRLREYRNDRDAVSLHEWRGGELSDGYGAYPFFVYLDREYGTDLVFEAIRQTHQRMPYPAIEAATGGHLAERFREFSLQAWGEAPYGRLGQWLGADAIPRRHEAQLDMEGDDAAVWRDSNPPPARAYAYYVFDARTSDPPARVRINNPYHDALPDGVADLVTAQLLYRRSGQPWSYQNLSANAGKSFCLEHPDEDYDEFGLIVTNASDLDLLQYAHPLAAAWNTCESSWVGTITGTRNYGLNGTTHYEAKDVRFAFDTSPSEGWSRFVPTAGELTYWREVPCASYVSPVATVNLADIAPTTSFLRVSHSGDEAPEGSDVQAALWYRGTARAEGLQLWHKTCPTGSNPNPSAYVFATSLTYFWTDPGTQFGRLTPSFDQDLIEGTVVENLGGVTQTWTWRFERAMD